MLQDVKVSLYRAWRAMWANPLLRASTAMWAKAIGDRLPPFWMRREIGGGRRASFVAVGYEFREHLKTFAGLKPSDSCLDVGCGCGRIALALSDYIDAGTYDGFDIQPEMIRWCRDNIAARHPNFRFAHADLFNSRYNPKGTAVPEDYRFPYEAGRFDVVFLASVFTHLRPPGFIRYLDEIARVLKPGGRVLATMFLIDGALRQAVESGRTKVDLRHRLDDHCWVLTKAMPEAAVGFDEAFALERIAAAGLRMDRVARGSWRGQGAKSFQDIIVATSSA